MSAGSQNNWRDNGVKIIPGMQLDFNTPQTPGMTRAAAINHARAGANALGRDCQYSSQCQDGASSSRRT